MVNKKDSLLFTIFLPIHVRHTTLTAIGVGAHSSVNDSTTYSAKDKQTIANYVIDGNTLVTL